MRRPVAVVAHMAPVYALIAAPVARPLRVPLLLWFTQQGGGSLLDAAARVVDAILTVDERSVPLRSSKVRAIGHGIDVDALPCVPERRAPLRRLLGLGRYAPVKGWATVLRALPELPEATLTLHGPRPHRCRPRPPSASSSVSRTSSACATASRSATRSPITEVPHLFGLADAVVNATRGNAADKVVYEAAAACLPVFAASPVFDSLLPEQLRFHGEYPGSLAERVRSYAGGAGPELRARVAAGALRRPLGRARARGRGSMRPRVLFVSRERFRLPLEGAQKRKWDAVGAGRGAARPRRRPGRVADA